MNLQNLREFTGNSKSGYLPRFSAIFRIINPVKGSYLTACFIFGQNCEILFRELQILYCRNNYIRTFPRTPRRFPEAIRILLTLLPIHCSAYRGGFAASTIFHEN